jgi:hypothetical protein
MSLKVKTFIEEKCIEGLVVDCEYKGLGLGLAPGCK